MIFDHPCNDAPVLSRGLRGWSDTTEMGHSCEGKLLLSHVPRRVVGGGVDRSFVEQPWLALAGSRVRHHR